MLYHLYGCANQRFKRVFMFLIVCLFFVLFALVLPLVLTVLFSLANKFFFPNVSFHRIK